MLNTVVPEGLRFGALFERLETVHSIYIRAGEAMASFRARNGLACPVGCGTCCEHFIPDILPVEASYLAAWLVRNQPKRALSLTRDGFPEEAEGCPLYNPNDPTAHCTVYPGRPLICRLFAFSGIRSKIGEPAFSLCRLMPNLSPPHADRRSWAGRELEDVLGVPPLMSDFAEELESVCPGDGSRRALLTEALPPAISQVFFLCGLRDDGKPGSDGNDPVTPLPQAS